MRIPLASNIVDLPELANKSNVFRDRGHAGEILAGMLETHVDSDAVVIAIPAGGVPVAKVLAEQLNLRMDIAVVSKITLPWNMEVGYGAVAFDGTVLLNSALLKRLGLSEKEIQQGIAKTSSKVESRVQTLRGLRAWPLFSQHPVILVDDGLASGFTMLVGLECLRKAGASRIVVAAPTGHERTVERIAGEAEKIYCANIRSGSTFAVADAYQLWTDVSEEEVRSILAAMPT